MMNFTRLPHFFSASTCIIEKTERILGVRLTLGQDLSFVGWLSLSQRLTSSQSEVESIGMVCRGQIKDFACTCMLTRSELTNAEAKSIKPVHD